MLKNVKQFAEFAIQPANWTNLVLFAGTMLVLISDGNSKAFSFSIGWASAAFVAFLPSLYSRAWRNRYELYAKADRSLAYCEGWKRCLEGLSGFNELEDGAAEEMKRKLVDSAFEDGLAYVESGKHMRISK